MNIMDLFSRYIPFGNAILNPPGSSVGGVGFPKVSIPFLTR